jgi:nicotinamidase/pyrazinamidase
MAKMNLDNRQIQDRVWDYLGRAEMYGSRPTIGDEAKMYDLEEGGIWDIWSGQKKADTRWGTERHKMGCFEGTFAQAIAYAVQQSEFYADFFFPGQEKVNSDGFLQKINPLPSEGDINLEGLILSRKLQDFDERLNTVAWNVDTQYDFMRPDGKLYVAGAEAIEPNLEKLTEYFKKKDIFRVNTADWHHKDSKELSANPDFVNTFPEHCMADTPGAEYVPASYPTEEEEPYIIDWKAEELDKAQVASTRTYVLLKDAFDVFGGNPHTEELLDMLHPKRAIVYGVATDYCVNYAVKGLLERGLEVYVVEDAIKEIASSEPVLQKWKELGVKFIRTDDLRK